MKKECENILFIEPLCKKKEHLSFNSDLISFLQQKYKISFCGSTQYSLNIKDYIQKFENILSIPFKKISIIELIRRYIFIWKAITKNVNNYSVILFSSFDNSIFSIFSILFYLFGGYRMKNTINILFIHNNLYSLKRNALKNYLLRISIKLYHWKCVVLTENMMLNFKDIMGNKPDIYLYPHPYYKINNIKPKNINIIKLLLVGRQADYAIKSLFLESLIFEINKIKTIGTSNRDIEIHISTNKSIPLEANFPIYKYSELTEKEYNNLFNSASFILFPYNYSDSFRASGVLMDAISFNTPIIAPKIGHFKEFNNCGLFYSSITELTNIVRKIMDIDFDEYNNFQESILKKKENIDDLKKVIFNLTVQQKPIK